MREMGARSADFHAGLADAVVAAGVARALLVGPAMAPLAHALKRRIGVKHLDNASQVVDALDLAADDVLLVKGSNGVGLEAVVAALREDAA